MAPLNCGHKDYCSLHNLDTEHNFCDAKGGNCRLKDAAITELPLLAVVKNSIARQERNSRLKK